MRTALSTKTSCVSADPGVGALESGAAKRQAFGLTVVEEPVAAREHDGPEVMELPYTSQQLGSADARDRGSTIGGAR